MRSLDRLMEIVARYYGLSVWQLKLQDRRPAIVYPRSIAMYLAVRVEHHQMTDVADAFERSDHTIVHHAVRRVEDYLDFQPKRLICGHRPGDDVAFLTALIEEQRMVAA